MVGVESACYLTSKLNFFTLLRDLMEGRLTLFAQHLPFLKKGWKKKKLQIKNPSRVWEEHFKRVLELLFRFSFVDPVLLINSGSYRFLIRIKLLKEEQNKNMFEYKTISTTYFFANINSVYSPENNPFNPFTTNRSTPRSSGP